MYRFFFICKASFVKNIIQIQAPILIVKEENKMVAFQISRGKSLKAYKTINKFLPGSLDTSTGASLGNVGRIEHTN